MGIEFMCGFSMCVIAATLSVATVERYYMPFYKPQFCGHGYLIDSLIISQFKKMPHRRLCGLKRMIKKKKA